MCHANRAASAASDATRRCNSCIVLSQGTASEASTGGRLSMPSPLARQAVRPKLLLGRIALAIAHGPRICCEALRKGIEERADRGNHAAPRWKHSMHDTGP